jgi:hypothetical protein
VRTRAHRPPRADAEWTAAGKRPHLDPASPFEKEHFLEGMGDSPPDGQEAVVAQNQHVLGTEIAHRPGCPARRKGNAFEVMEGRAPVSA